MNQVSIVSLQENSLLGMLLCYLRSVIRLTWRYPALPPLFICANTWITIHVDCSRPFTRIAGLAITISGSSFIIWFETNIPEEENKMDHQCRIS